MNGCVGTVSTRKIVILVGTKGLVVARPLRNELKQNKSGASLERCEMEQPTAVNNHMPECANLISVI